MSVGREAFGIRTFVWHADFIDTYLRGGLERQLGRLTDALGLGALGEDAAPRAVDVSVEPLWAWVRTITRACDATFAASKFQVEKLEAHGAVRVEYLPFGVEKAVFTPTRRDEALRTELLRGRKGPLVASIGRFAVEKRWDVVLDAYERFAETHPGSQLLLLGDGPEKGAIEARTAGRDDIRILGFERSRERVATILASSDVLFHGCPYETFGLGVAEAIATGLPAVLPDEGGAAEQALGDSTVTYPSLDASALAASATALLAHPPARLRAAAIATAARVGSIEDHFQRLFARYADLLAARSGR
jgi:alpha-1,6-mannosyltransferase